MDYQQIEAMHQEVRTFVEQQEPTYKVVSISGYTTTTYMPTPETQYEISPSHAEFILAGIQVRFRVEAHYLASHRRLTCEVYVTSDGKLSLADHVLSL